MGSYARNSQLAPRTVSYYVDREEEEEACLSKASKYKEVVLTGARGNGKTQLARRVAQKILRTNPESRVEEIDGTSVEVMRNLLHQVNQCEETHRSAVIILDGTNQETQTILNYLHLERPPSWIYIITTLDETMNYGSEPIKVDGLKRQQFFQLVKNLSSSVEQPVISDNLIDEFLKVFDGNPLDLYYAVQYMKKTCKRDEELLQFIQDGHVCALQNERSLFKENEYSSSSLTAIQEDIAQIERNLEHHQHTLQTLCALAFFDSNDIPIEVFDEVFGKQSYSIVDTLLSEVSTFSLGKVRRSEHDLRILTLNKAFQRALICKLDDTRREKALELAHKVLLHLCHKDNRVNDDYQSQIDMEPHITAILYQKLIKKTISFTIKKLWILSILGHFYIQTEKVAKGEQVLKDAFKVIENDLLHKKVKLFELTENDVHLLLDLGKADDTYESAVREFIQSLRISCADKQKWPEKDLSINLSNKVTSLTPQLYERLVEGGCAYDMKTVVPYFIAELVATVLYSYGRIFIYAKENRVEKEKALEVSKMICNKIEAIYEVRLLHTLLVDRNGLLCFKLIEERNGQRSPNDVKANAAEAESRYEELLNQSCDRYEYGLLKAIGNETYHRLVCLRYQLKANTLICKLANSAEEKAAQRSRIEQIVSNIDNITGDRGSHTGNLQRNTSMNTEIGRAFMALDDLTYLEKAKSRFLNVCEVESKSNKINYPWMEALQGLNELVSLWQPYDVNTAHKIGKRAVKEINAYKRRSNEFEGYDSNVESATKLLNEVRSKLDDINTPHGLEGSTGYQSNESFNSQIHIDDSSLSHANRESEA